jgi:outer membrane protein
MIRKLIRLTATVALAGLSFAVSAHDAGDWLVRARAINVNPDAGDTGPALVNGVDVGIGNNLFDIDDAWTLDIDLSYFFTANLAVELAAALPSEHDVVSKNPAAGEGKIAQIDVLPLTALLQYHFLPQGTVQPYVGLGINHTTFQDEEVTDDPEPGETLDVDSSTGLALQAGADIGLGGGWFANLDVKWLDVETKFTGNVPSEGTVTIDDVKVDPWVIGIGIGRAF